MLFSLFTQKYKFTGTLSDHIFHKKGIPDHQSFSWKTSAKHFLFWGGEGSAANLVTRVRASHAEVAIGI